MGKDLSPLEFGVLQSLWLESSVVPSDAQWVPLEGGRSNPIWRIDSDKSASLVCKLFLPNTATPLFANEGVREAIALSALRGNQIAPDLVAFKDSAIGESLVYKHIPGRQWHAGVTNVALLMTRLHHFAIPEGLPTMNVTPASLIADGFAMLGEASARLPAPPVVSECPAQGQVFLHGDVVPGNILEVEDGLRLIDWQCPAAGDPSADLAVFLSPAMQWIYGGRILSADETDTFLNTYARASKNAEAVERYKILAPLYHWRMAAYCCWKADRGDKDYAYAMTLELAGLQKT